MKVIEFHDALYDRIRTTVDKRIPLYDYLPPSEPLPIIVLAEAKAEETEELASKCGNGYAITQKIVIATRTKEKRFALSIFKQIQQALETELEVDGAFNLRQKFLNMEIVETSDAKYYCETNFEIWLLDKEEEQ